MKYIRYSDMESLLKDSLKAKYAYLGTIHNEVPASIIDGSIGAFESLLEVLPRMAVEVSAEVKENETN